MNHYGARDETKKCLLSWVNRKGSWVVGWMAGYIKEKVQMEQKITAYITYAIFTAKGAMENGYSCCEGTRNDFIYTRHGWIFYVTQRDVGTGIQLRRI